MGLNSVNFYKITRLIMLNVTNFAGLKKVKSYNLCGLNRVKVTNLAGSSGSLFFFLRVLFTAFFLRRDSGAIVTGAVRLQWSTGVPCPIICWGGW